MENKKKTDNFSPFLTLFSQLKKGENSLDINNS